MGQWLARVHFPNGQVRYARYSTVVEALVSDLHDHFRDKGEPDDLGNVSYRASVAGELLPADPNSPLSEPQDVIPVRLEVEPDGRTWPALYCPRRRQIIGPHSKFTAWRVQETFNLVRRGDRLHLVHAWAPAGAPHAGKGWLGLRRKAETEPDRRAWTLCGEPAAGEVIPFLRYSDTVYELTNTPEESIPARRNLYAEWGGGLVCQRCLLHDEALNAQ